MGKEFFSDGKKGEEREGTKKARAVKEETRSHRDFTLFFLAHQFEILGASYFDIAEVATNCTRIACAMGRDCPRRRGSMVS